MSPVDELPRSETGALHSSALTGDLSTFGQLINAHSDLVNKTDDYGLTPLHYAAYGCRVEIVEQLLGAGTDVDAADSWGNTPLFYSAKEGGAHCVRVLLGAGADPNLSNLDNETPLERSVSCRKVQMPRELYETDPEPFTQPLLFAPFYQREWRGGDASVVLELVNGGAQLSAEEQVFLNHCKEMVNRTDWPRLRAVPSSASDGDTLSDLGFFDIAIKDEGLRWCVLPHQLLHHAANMGYVGAMAYLMIKGGVPADGESELGNYQLKQTPLHQAATSGAMLLLIKAGANINARSSGGHTPFLSLWCDPIRVQGDSYREPETNSWTAIPPKEPPEKLGRFLVDHGADPNARVADSDYPTPIHLWWNLTESVAGEVAEHLLDLGFDADPQSNDEEPIIIMVAWGQDTELLEKLIESGADPEVRSSEGHTAMLVSQLNGWGSRHVIELLQKHGVKLHTPEELEARRAHPK